MWKPIGLTSECMGGIIIGVTIKEKLTRRERRAIEVFEKRSSRIGGVGGSQNIFLLLSGGHNSRMAQPEEGDR